MSASTPGTDGSDALLLDVDFRAADALDEGDHGRGDCGICGGESVRFGPFCHVGEKCEWGAGEVL